MKQHQQLLHSGRAALLLLAFATAMPGCASIASFAAMRSVPVAGPGNPIRDIACIWQQGEGRDERGRPCRGFCGQLMFLTSTSKKPGIVRGAASIYVFDNVGTVQEQSRPLEEFHFTAAEWNSFQRMTNLGMTYQLFIPYSRPGGHDAECQVHIKFVPEGSETPIWSHPESIALRGSTGPAALANAIDRTLNATSPLFSKSASLMPSAGPDYESLLKKLQEDAKPPVDSVSPRLPSPSARVPAVHREAEVERLQAVLEASTSGAVEQAAYAESAGRREQVSQAVHEENSP
jgi:hypothetical protein